MQIGGWFFLTGPNQRCLVLELNELWNRSTALVWLPDSGSVTRVPTDLLRPIEEYPPHSSAELSYICAASRIREEMGKGVLLAPLEGSLIPLPHQLQVLQKVIDGDRIRYLLADEVGLGKTIEAGLVLRELKNRGLVRRVLIVTPAGLVMQWIGEMRTRFGEEFRWVNPGEFSTLRRLGVLDDEENPWERYDQVLCSIDSVKPVETRRGWSIDQVTRQNRERFQNLVTAGWDLIIVDEAHRLGGMSSQIARFKLGEGLSKASPYLLLLSATPHQGKTDSFRRLIRFLDADALPDDDPITRESVAPLVIRTEKRKAIDADGNPLFQPRSTRLEVISWGESKTDQKSLYRAVTEYVRDGYNQAMRERRTAHGLLMILMQRLVSSSVAAIRTAMEKRLHMLQLPEEQLSLFQEDIAESWNELDGQEQMEELLEARLKGLHDERREVELILSAARSCEARAPDAKTEALLETIQAFQREESDPDLKVLVFTEFIPTQSMLASFLENRGYPVVTLNGSMTLDERLEAQRRFAGPSQVMISTDAGGEGLNLQFGHVVINYDLPWNPMKIEQRIGRVDRIGQTRPVRVVNFTMAETVELRVREVIEQKLQTVLQEFGVDKLSDILDSEESGQDFQSLYVASVVSPEAVEERAEQLLAQIRCKALETLAAGRILAGEGSIDPEVARRVAESPMHGWTERMVVGYLQSRSHLGASVSCSNGRYLIRWPDGKELDNVVFYPGSSSGDGEVLLTLEDRRVRAILDEVPGYSPGQTMPAIVFPGISDRVGGFWSLWRIGLDAGGDSFSRYAGVFVTDEGRGLLPTARTIWDRLIEAQEACSIMQPVTGDLSVTAFRTALAAAEETLSGLFEEMTSLYRERLAKGSKKKVRAISSRREAIARLSGEKLMKSKLAALDKEQTELQGTDGRRPLPLPSLSCVLMVRVVPEAAKK